MASGPITSWKIDGETMEIVADSTFGGFKITVDGDCSHEIKRCLFLGRKVMTNLEWILKSSFRQGYGFSSSHVWCESWTIRKAECRRIDAFELWYWRILLGVPCTARRSNQSILMGPNKQPWIFTGRYGCWNLSANTLATWCEEPTC